MSTGSLDRCMAQARSAVQQPQLEASKGQEDSPIFDMVNKIVDFILNLFTSLFEGISGEMSNSELSELYDKGIESNYIKALDRLSLRNSIAIFYKKIRS